MTRFVLVHGWWSDAEAWTATADLLRSAGHEVATPELPAHGTDPMPPAQVGLDNYVDAVAKAAAGLGGPVVLAGHSMAGAVISVLAEQEPDLVEHLVYLAAFLLPSGQTVFGFTQTSPGFCGGLLSSSLRPADGLLGVDPDRARDVFMADAPGDLAEAALGRLRAAPLAPLLTPVWVTRERWGRVPRSYLHTTADQALPLASQLEMVACAPQLNGTHRLPTSHMPMLSAPDATAAALIELTAQPPVRGGRNSRHKPKTS
jgi:pimeloyl-ACP methyl ester carboxylesterase